MIQVLGPDGRRRLGYDISLTDFCGCTKKSKIIIEVKTAHGYKGGFLIYTYFCNQFF